MLTFNRSSERHNGIEPLSAQCGIGRNTQSSTDTSSEAILFVLIEWSRDRFSSARVAFGGCIEKVRVLGSVDQRHQECRLLTTTLVFGLQEGGPHAVLLLKRTVQLHGNNAWQIGNIVYLRELQAVHGRSVGAIWILDKFERRNSAMYLTASLVISIR